MNKIESYCYQKYKSSSNNSCVIKEKNIVGKNLLEGTYFDGNGVPKMIGITKAEYLEYKKLQQENEHLDEVNCKLRRKIGQLEDNWNKLKQKMIDSFNESQDVQFLDVLQDMQELEKGSDSNE